MEKSKINNFTENKINIFTEK